MSLRNAPLARPNRPLLRESALVAATLGCLFLWQRLARAVTGPPSAFDFLPSPASFVLGAAATSAVFVAGVALVVGAYAALRGVDAGLRLPTRADLRLLGLACAVPVALVGLTRALARFTGVPYGSLTMTYYAADPPMLPVLTIIGVGAAVGAPCLALVCQVLVQGGLERVLDGESAVVPTTLVAGFVATSNTGGLTAVPDRGRLAGAAVFLALFAASTYAAERVRRERLRAVAYLPVLLFVALVVVSGVAAVESAADGLFALTRLAVLGVAAYAYDRSDSLFVPAAAYLCLSLADQLVTLLESGGPPPF